MTNISLAVSYLIKARKRLRVLRVLLDEGDFSDVVREAQEIVELALKGMLRQIGVEPKYTMWARHWKNTVRAFPIKLTHTLNASHRFPVGSVRNASFPSMAILISFPLSSTRRRMPSKRSPMPNLLCLLRRCLFPQTSRLPFLSFYPVRILFVVEPPFIPTRG